MRTIIILFCIILSNRLSAADKSDFKPIHLSLIPGFAHALSSFATLRTISGTTLATIKAESPTPSISLDARVTGLYEGWEYFVALRMMASEFASKGTGKPDLNLKGFFLMPGFSGSWGKFHPWYGFGVGLVMLSIDPHNFNGPGIAATFDEGTTSLGTKLAVGADYDLTDRFTMGGEMSYIWARFSLGGVAVAGSSTTPLDASGHLSFINTGVRLGVRF